MTKVSFSYEVSSGPYLVQNVEVGGYWLYALCCERDRSPFYSGLLPLRLMPVAFGVLRVAQSLTESWLCSSTTECELRNNPWLHYRPCLWPWHVTQSPCLVLPCLQKKVRIDVFSFFVSLTLRWKHCNGKTSLLSVRPATNTMTSGETVHVYHNNTSRG